MLSKKILLATVLGLCFSFNNSAHSRAWHNTTISARLNDDTYLTQQRWRLHLAGIKIPTAEKITPQNQCYAKELQRFLDQKIVGKNLKFKNLTQPSPRQTHRWGFIKFDNTYDLGLFLLKQGWAHTNLQTHAQSKAYQNAQAKAQTQKKGLWGQCDAWHQLRERQRLAGKSLYFKSHNQSFLQPVSTGWVKKVLSPTRLQLDNGLKIKLQGLKEPLSGSPLYSCWQTAAKQSLESLVLGKKIRLERDHLQLTNTGQFLQRYAWLEGNQFSQPVFLNTWLITNSWAQLEDQELNLKYVDEMHNAQKSWQNSPAPPEWWAHCAQSVIQPANPSSSTKADPTCPIKGNIAGSKKNPKRTYHTSQSGWYKRIKPEQCFNSQEEAQEAGFTKVK